MGALGRVWRMPGNAWHAALKAANITLWWRFGAALVVSLTIAMLIYIFWRASFWPAEAWRVRADWLGYTLMWSCFTQIICIVAIMDFRLNFRASRQGIEANMAGDEHEKLEPLTVETKTTTTVQQAVAAPDDGELPLDKRVKL